MDGSYLSTCMNSKSKNAPPGDAYKLTDATSLPQEKEADMAHRTDRSSHQRRSCKGAPGSSQVKARRGAEHDEDDGRLAGNARRLPGPEWCIGLGSFGRIARR